MPDEVESALGWADLGLEILGAFLPGVSAIPLILKLVGFAKATEPDAAALLTTLHGQAQAGPLTQDHADQIAAVNDYIEHGRDWRRAGMPGRG